MEKNDFMQSFSQRLRNAMIAAGHHSPRTPSGVDIDKLVEITGYSPQICRKYLRGQAIPEPLKLSDIATKLNVSPGWLLFGENPSTFSSKQVTISKRLLHYIFMQINELYHIEQCGDEIPNFLLNLTNNISQINTTEEQSKKIIDLAMASAQHFRT